MPSTPIQQREDFKTIKSKIFTIVARLDNGSHSSHQLQGIDEAILELFNQYRQELIQEITNYEKPYNRVWGEEFDDGFNQGLQVVIDIINNRE